MAPLFGAERGPSTQDKKTKPRQEELAGPRRQGPGKRSLPGRPSRSTKAPAGGARREGRTKAPQEKLAAARHALRQGLMSSKLSGAASGRRGKPLAAASRHLRPALQLTRPRVALGLPPKARGGAPRGLRCAVACNGHRGKRWRT